MPAPTRTTREISAASRSAGEAARRTTSDTAVRGDAGPLHPGRVLLEPSFLIAVAILAINDHLLKASDAIPAWLTGKLSDFAGLFFAPALLAVLVRVRTRRGLALAAAITGAVFASIKLAPDAARAFEALTALAGFPWRIVSDPTDLVALIALPLSVARFLPIMRRPADRTRARLLFERTAGAAATLACVGSSPEPCDWCGPSGTAYLVNDTPEDLTVRVKRLRRGVEVRCEDARKDPGVVLAGEVFQPGATFRVASGTTLPLPLASPADPNQRPAPRPSGDPGCDAWLVEGEWMSSTVIVMPASSPLRSIPRVFVRSDGAQIARPAGQVAMLPGPEGTTVLESRDAEVVLGPRTRVISGDLRQCTATSTTVGLGWTEVNELAPLPIGRTKIEEVERGPDGCTRLLLRHGRTWATGVTVCAPEEALPFVSGDKISITSTPPPDRRLDIEVARTSSTATVAVGIVRLWAARELPHVDGLLLRAEPVPGCPAAVSACGSYATPHQVLVTPAGGGERVLASGEPIRFSTLDGGEASFWFVRGQDTAVAAPDCDDGVTEIGTRYESVLSIRYPLAR